MAFDYDFTQKLKIKVLKLKKKDRKRAGILHKKIKQIIELNESEIGHFKNLSRGLSDRKRVHIDKSFVLTFKFDREKKFILFIDFDHHDNIYKK